jgi:hypothetical protein
MKDAVLTWWRARVAKAYYKSTSFITNALAVLVGLVPDLINLVLTSWSMVDAGLPTLSAEHKLYLFGAANVLAMVLRAFKQKSVERASIEQAAEAGKVVPLPASGVQTPTNK